MTDFDLLKSEFSLPAYDKMDLSARVAAINSRNLNGLIPYSEFQRSLMQMQCWGMIRLASLKSDTPDALRAACLVAVDLLTVYRSEGVDVSLDAFQAVLAGLVAASLVTADEQTAINALAANRRSRAELLWGDGTIVSVDDAMRAN